MADALRNSGRDIAFGVCEWGLRSPWLWAAEAGGQLWRSTGDVRDKWKNLDTKRHPNQAGYGILDIVDYNAPLYPYAGPGHWNDMDMLVVGMYGKKGPSGDLGGVGCTDIEYQTQMGLWCMMCSPLAATNDVRNMNDETKRILLNEEIIAINQDALGKRKISNDTLNVFVKPLTNGGYAIAVLNRSDATQTFTINFADLGLNDKYEIKDLWQHKIIGNGKKWKGMVQSHETKVFRLKK